MAYSFASRHDRLRTRMREVNSRTVTYRRGARSAEVLATVHELGPDELVAMGLPSDVRRRGYVIDVADLEEVGNPFEHPKQGDRVEDGDLTCQALPMGSNEPVYRYTNHQRKAYRIHTQLVGL